MYLSILLAAVAAAVRTLVGKWFDGRGDQEKEQLHATIDATREEAKDFAAPARPKPAVIELLRDHAE